MNDSEAIQKVEQALDELQQQREQRPSLRDWFAGYAVGGLLASGYSPEASAERAYETADAMLRARVRQ